MKKGDLLISTVVILALALFSVFIVIVFLNGMQANIKGKSNEAVVQQWVDIVTLREKVSRRAVAEGRPPIDQLNPTPIIIKDETELQSSETKQKIADAMVSCWRAFDRGEKNFLSQLPGSHDVFCFPCSVVQFDEGLKDGNHKIRGLSQYLTETKMGNGMEYAKYLSNKNEELAKQPILKDDAIPIDADWYIFFMAFSSRGWKSIAVVAAEGAEIGAIAGGIVGTIPGAVVGGLVGGGGAVLGEILSRGLYEPEFKPVIAVNSADVINRACNQCQNGECIK